MPPDRTRGRARSRPWLWLLERGLQLLKGRFPLLHLLSLLLPFLLLSFDLFLKAAGHVDGLYLGLEEVLGTLNALCGDIDLGQAGQDVQAAVFLQLPCCCLAEDQKELPEAEFAVEILVHLLDHTLEAQVCLGGPQLLHHEFQLHQVDEAIPAGIILLEHLLHVFDLLPGELLELGVGVEDAAAGRLWLADALVEVRAPQQLGAQLVVRAAQRLGSLVGSLGRRRRRRRREMIWAAAGGPG